MRFLTVTEDSVATYKLALALITFPLAYASWIVAAMLVAGPIGGAVTAVLPPALGAFALRWSRRWERVKEDTRVFLAVLRHPRAHNRLVEERARIIAEIDAVRELIE
jgi:hypothetical protein